MTYKRHILSLRHKDLFYKFIPGVLVEFDKLKVLRSEDKPKLLAFEQKKTESTSDLDPLDFMKNWSAPWREESLDHYLGLGWSMGWFMGRSDDRTSATSSVVPSNNSNSLDSNSETKIEGYILAQPILFFGGHTQSLWIETIRAQSEIVFFTLLEAVSKIAKEKHLQQIFFQQSLVQDFETNLAPNLQGHLDSQLNDRPQSHNINGLKLHNLKIEKLSDISFIKTTRWEN